MVCLPSLLSLSVLATRAHGHAEEPLIQPGAAAFPAHTPLGPFSPCTLNFVFRDRRATYIGTAARCTYQVGERVSMADREFGTVVFRVFTGTDALGQSATDPSAIDDFALIRIDDEHLDRVSPVVLGFNRAPHGHTTSTGTPDGDVVFVSGQGIATTAATRLRPGVLLSDDPHGFRADLPIMPGDGGAPVMYQDLALGVVSAHGVPGAFGTTVERILVLLREAGFGVRLVDGGIDRTGEAGPSCQQVTCLLPT